MEYLEKLEDQMNAAPESEAAERYLIGRLYNGDPEAMFWIDRIDAEDFEISIHRRLFEVAMEDVRAGRPASPINLIGTDYEGYMSYASELETTSFPGGDMEQVVGVILESSRKRKIVVASSEVSDLVLNDQLSAEEAMQTLQDVFEKLDQKSGGPVHVGEYLAKGPVVNDIFNFEGKIETTQFANLDKALGGGIVGDTNMIAVCARAGVGKTSFFVNRAIATAIDLYRTGSDQVVYLISLEMNVDQLIYKMLSCLCQFDVLKMTEDEKAGSKGKSIMDNMNLLQQLPIVVDGDHVDTRTGRYVQGPRTIQEIQNRCAGLYAKYGRLAMIGIDYLQLIEDPTIKNDNYKRVSKLSRLCKGHIASRYGQLWVLVQLSRAVERRSDKRPLTSDLRDSGQIEQDCDYILGLYEHDPEGLPGVVTCAGMKNRHNIAGDCTFRFAKDHSRFYECVVEREPLDFT